MSLEPILSSKYLRNAPAIFTIVTLLIGAIVLSLFARWEPSHETWGYWAFARILEETKRFIILDRSPLYTLYLIPFRWLGYPLAVDVEYIITTCITTLSLFFFARIFFQTPIALLASIIWIPYLQVSEPPVQKLALAATLWALRIRLKETTRGSLSHSYALLLASFLLRSTYSVLISLFAISDCITFVRNGVFKKIRQFRISKKTDIPLLAVMSLVAFIVLLQSPHPWNTIWFTSTEWFPYTGKKFEIQSPYNGAYIHQNFQQIPIADFYFTNKELFKGTNTTIGALQANPQFVLGQTINFMLDGIPVIAQMTSVPRVLEKMIDSQYSYHISVISIVLFLIGAIVVAKEKRILTVFFLGSVGMVLTSVFFGVQSRYLFPLVPILIMSASWYSTIVIRFVPLVGSNTLLRVCVYLFFLLIFTNHTPLTSDTSGWIYLAKNVATDMRERNMRLMTDSVINIYSSSPPMKLSYSRLASLLKGCHGIMSLEHAFISAFMDVPLTSVFDVFEIPPFGQLNTTEYKGLTPMRINCVLVSQNLEFAMGMPTNHQIRYQNYIKPYVAYLQNLGAKILDIPPIGRAIILK